MAADTYALVASLALLLLAGGGAIWVLLGRPGARRAARPQALLRPRPRIEPLPLVLAHGFLGFDHVAIAGLRHEYFRGVGAHLRGLGHEVHIPRVTPVASIRRRAEELADRIDALGAERVHIIAHSMGGLDARYAISKLGLHERVASLTTIGTPHHGTPLANTSLLLDRIVLARRIFGGLGVEIEGMTDLSTERMARFNMCVMDEPDVRYRSYVGSVPVDSRAVHRLLMPAFLYLCRVVGDNDGIVPAGSQRWGEVVGEVTADHWAQIGWSGGFDVRSFYARLAHELNREPS